MLSCIPSLRKKGDKPRIRYKNIDKTDILHTSFVFSFEPILRNISESVLCAVLLNLFGDFTLSAESLVT